MGKRIDILFSFALDAKETKSRTGTFTNRKQTYLLFRLALSCSFLALMQETNQRNC